MLKLTMLVRRKPWRPPLLQAELSDEDPISSCLSSVQLDMISESLRVMLRQEKSRVYCGKDYLHFRKKELRDIDMRSEFKDRRGGHGSKPIDSFCREQICEWMYRVVDYFRIDREVVSVSMSYLDRFLAVYTCDRRVFKLVATSALHLAVKIFHPRKLNELSILSDLSRGEFDMDDVIRMEAVMLHALCWQLHPPTSVSFISTLFAGVPTNSISKDDIDVIYHLATFFAELAVCDYFFVTQHASTVALASILNAMEGLSGEVLPFPSFAEQLSHEVDISIDSEEISYCRDRLWELYERSEECAVRNNDNQEGGLHLSPKAVALPNKQSLDKAMSSINVSSPVCVSDA